MMFSRLIQLLTGWYSGLQAERNACCKYGHDAGEIIAALIVERNSKIFRSQAVQE
jgi:hypothetical protein